MSFSPSPRAGATGWTGSAIGREQLGVRVHGNVTEAEGVFGCTGP